MPRGSLRTAPPGPGRAGSLLEALGEDPPPRGTSGPSHGPGARHTHAGLGPGGWGWRPEEGPGLGAAARPAVPSALCGARPCPAPPAGRPSRELAASGQTRARPPDQSPHCSGSGPAKQLAPPYRGEGAGEGEGEPSAGAQVQSKGAGGDRGTAVTAPGRPLTVGGSWALDRGLVPARG